MWKLSIALVAASLAACKSPSSSSPSSALANHAPQPTAQSERAGPRPDDVCCCERLHPANEEPGAPWESRAAACLHGTPTMPEGRCVDWAQCGQPSNAHLTIADRPELAAPVAVAPGNCCCSMPDWFRVVDVAACKTGCLEPEWCASPPPKRPVTDAPPANGDRCVAIADHFEPWRSKQYWKDEISPRAKLIADCKAQHWSVELENCLLAANSPLDLDACVGV